MFYVCIDNIIRKFDSPCINSSMDNETESRPDTQNFAKAEMLIRKPVNEVFEAFINPEITTNYR